MEGQLGTVEIIITIIGGCAAIIGGLFRFYVINKRDRDARFQELEERHNRQRAEDMARQEKQREEDLERQEAQRKEDRAQRQEDLKRQEAQRQEDREELRDIKDHVYNHLPTQIRAIEREIKGLRDMIVKYIFDKSVSETKHEEQD